MAGLIMVIIGLVISTIDIPIVKIADYPEYTILYEQDAYGKVVIGNNGSIKMDGYFDLGIEADVTRVPTSALTIDANVNVYDITLKSATGIFDPEINISSLGDVSVTGVPDFLSEDGVRADLDNPQIILSIKNDMDAAAKVSAKVISTKNGQNLAIVQPPEMNICKTTVAPVTKICICRHKTAELTAQYGAANVYEVSNLATLINQHIPDYVQITDVETKADLSQEMTIEFGRYYKVVPSYEIYAPLAFAEDAVIEYADDFDGWNDDLDDLELSEGTYVRLTADAQNLVPATLIVEATPLGVGGTDISNLIEVNVKKGTVKASADGVTAVNSPLEIELREKVKGGLQKLDGLSYKVKGKASHECLNLIDFIYGCWLCCSDIAIACFRATWLDTDSNDGVLIGSIVQCLAEHSLILRGIDDQGIGWCHHNVGIRMLLLDF